MEFLKNFKEKYVEKFIGKPLVEFLKIIQEFFSENPRELFECNAVAIYGPIFEGIPVEILGETF